MSFQNTDVFALFAVPQTNSFEVRKAVGYYVHETKEATMDSLKAICIVLLKVSDQNYQHLPTDSLLICPCDIKAKSIGLPVQGASRLPYPSGQGGRNTYILAYKSKVASKDGSVSNRQTIIPAVVVDEDKVDYLPREHSTRKTETNRKKSAKERVHNRDLGCVVSGSSLPCVPCPRKDDLYIRYDDQLPKTALVVQNTPLWIEGAHIFPVAHEQEWNARPTLLAGAAADSGSYFVSSHMKDSPLHRGVDTGPAGLNSLKNMLSMQKPLHRIFDDHCFSICPVSLDIVPFRVLNPQNLAALASTLQALRMNPAMRNGSVPIVDALRHHWAQACRRYCRVNSI